MLEAARVDPAEAKFLQCDGPFPIFWTPSSLLAPVLAAWAGGPAARRLEGRTGEDLVGVALDQIAEGFMLDRARLASDLVEVGFHDWTSDPCSRGAYCHALVGGADSHKALARATGRVHYAGEAASESMGTVTGAYDSGLRAAREVLAESA